MKDAAVKRTRFAITTARLSYYHRPARNLLENMAFSAYRVHYISFNHDMIPIFIGISLSLNPWRRELVVLVDSVLGDNYLYQGVTMPLQNML